MNRVLAIALGIVSLLPSAHLAWQGRDLPHLGSFHDDAIYLETARNLALDNSYRIGSLPWAPAQTKYPPLYPLYLSIAWRVSPDIEKALPMAMLLNWLWLPVWLIGIFQLLRRNNFPPRFAAVLPILIALHPEVQFASTRLMSDLMFAALLTWSLALLPATSSLAVAALAYFTRVAALPLYAGLMLLDLRKRQWRRLSITLLGAALPIGAWALWVSTQRHDAATSVEKYYTDYFAYQLEAVPLAALPAHVYYRQLDALMNSIAHLLLLNFGDSLGWVMLNRLAVVAAVTGIVRLMRRDQLTAFAYYALPATAMTLVWYFRPEPRFLLPLLPLLAAGLFTEISVFAAALRGAWDRRGADRIVATACLALCAPLPLCAVRNALSSLDRNGESVFRMERQSQSHVRVAYRWILANTTPNQTFFAVDDPGFYLYTRRQALRLPQLDHVLAPAPHGRYQPSRETLAAMKRFKLSCFYFSTKNFEETPSSLPIDVSSSGLKERYRSSTELIACRPD